MAHKPLLDIGSIADDVDSDKAATARILQSVDKAETAPITPSEIAKKREKAKKAEPAPEMTHLSMYIPEQDSALVDHAVDRVMRLGLARPRDAANVSRIGRMALQALADLPDEHFAQLYTDKQPMQRGRRRA